VVLAVLGTGAQRDLLALTVFVLIPGSVGAAIIAAPPGGWLVVIGLVASAVGILVYLIVASFAAWLGAITGGQSGMSSAAVVILLIPLMSGLATVLRGVLDLAMEPPRGSHT
jgi:hypothetical protein